MKSSLMQQKRSMIELSVKIKQKRVNNLKVSVHLPAQSFNVVFRTTCHIFHLLQLLLSQDLSSVECSQCAVFVNEIIDFYGQERDLNIVDVAAGTGALGKCVGIFVVFQRF